jgi:hypothetical protein
MAIEGAVAALRQPVSHQTGLPVTEPTLTPHEVGVCPDGAGALPDEE